MASQVVGVVVLVGMALSVSVGMGLVAVQDLDGTRRPVVVADAWAWDPDLDGVPEGARVYVQNSEVASEVRLLVFEEGELIGVTRAEDRRDGLWVSCGAQDRVLDTQVSTEHGRQSAGSVTVSACWGESWEPEDPEECAYELCEDPTIPECPEASGDTTESSCWTRSDDPEGCELLGVRVYCLR